MPTLADIYSALNTFKRKSSDFVQNPGTSLEQMLFAANENAREFNKKHALATDYTIAQARGQQPTPEQAQAEMGLRNTLSQAYSPGMTVWHGSPHVFERFDLSKIGTGEGAQAYGHGMYVAQSPDVARTYQNTLSKYGELHFGDGKIKNVADLPYGSPEQIAGQIWLNKPNLSDAKFALNNYDAKYLGAPKEEVLKQLENLDKAKAKLSGSFYKVDLPDTHIRRMLDWDAPLKDQPTPVRKLAKALGMDMSDLGGDLLAKVGKDEAGRKILQDAGIRGIKYLDQQSRDTAKGSRNFVVFDPSHMTILERNQQALNK